MFLGEGRRGDDLARGGSPQSQLVRQGQRKTARVSRRQRRRGKANLEQLKSAGRNDLGD